jgi:hypothetical protein
MINEIMDYEEGKLNEAETLQMFAHLIESGLAWQLQGHYGRTASAMIKSGLITERGELTDYARDLV